MSPTPTDDFPLLHIERISQYVALSPAALSCALPATCAEVFSPLLLCYYAPVKGVVLGYDDVRLSSEAPRSKILPPSKKDKSKKRKRRHEDDEDDAVEPPRAEIVMAHQIDEYSAPYLWATANLLVWRPQTHTAIPAILTHASATHITLAHLNTFPISVLRAELPTDWEWYQERGNAKAKGWDGRIADVGGWWVDGGGDRVGVGEELNVWIVSWEAKAAGSEGDGAKGAKGVLGMKGSLLEPEVREARSAGTGASTGVGRVAARTMERAAGEAIAVD